MGKIHYNNTRLRETTKFSVSVGSEEGSKEIQISQRGLTSWNSSRVVCNSSNGLLYQDGSPSKFGLLMKNFDWAELVCRFCEIGYVIFASAN